MIRIRTQDGSTQVVDKKEAVEILSDDGRLGMVIITTRRDTIHVLIPGDPLFTGYCKTHGMLPAKVNRHSDMAVEDF